MRSTFMSVEIAHAIITAAGHVGLPERDLQGVFFGNGMGLLQGVRAGEAVRAIEDAWTG